MLAVPGLAAAAGATVMEATTFPAIAADVPHLLAWGGPILAGSSARIVIAAAVAYFLGFVLVALGVARAGVLPAAPGWLFAVSLVLYAALAGPFVPILGFVGPAPRRRGALAGNGNLAGCADRSSRCHHRHRPG